jgi:uncharacterized membrane protein
LLVALSPCAIASSQEARAYSFLVLAVVISTYLFVGLIERPSYEVAIGYGIVAGLACYFHYFGVLVPAAHAVSMIVMPRGRSLWRQYLVVCAIFSLMAIPVLWLIHAQDIGHISWVPRPSLLEFYHLGVFLAANGGKAVGAVLLALDVVLVGLFLAKLRSVWRERDNDLERWRYALVASSFFSPIVITLAISVVRPAFYHRFLVICLPSFVMMTAVGATQIRRRSWRISVISGVCVLSLVSTVILYTRVTEDWRGAISYLVRNARSDERVLYYQSVGYFAGENYRDWLSKGGGPHPWGVGVNPGSKEWEREVGQAPRVWLVLYRAKIDDPESRAIQEELLKRYNRGEQKQFRGITVLEYDAR